MSLLWACLAVSAARLPAQDDGADDSFGPKPAGDKRARELYEADKARYKDNANILVLPGVVADRQRKRVEVLVEFTGVGDNEAVEFLVVDKSSSHGYEALLWSHAKPSDVHKALEFIDLPAGKPYDPNQLRFWAQGRRVVLGIVDGEPGTDHADKQPVRLEQFLLDRSTDETVAEDGFVFAGSMTAPSPDGKSKIYAADVYDPKSVVSMFNCPVTVLDVPRQALQGEVYDQYRVNPEYSQSHGTLATLLIEPHDKDGGRTRDLTLEIGMAAKPTTGPDAPAGAQSNRLSFRLLDEDAKAINDDPSIGAALDGLLAAMKRGEDIQLGIRFDSPVCLADTRQVCLILALMEARSGIKIKAPEAGQLYYRAFTPNELWRKRENRPVPSWELRLSGDAASVAGELILNGTASARDPTAAATTPAKVAVATSEALKQALDAGAQRREKEGGQPPPPILFVFADADLTYGQLVTFLTPAMATYKTVHVFMAEP